MKRKRVKKKDGERENTTEYFGMWYHNIFRNYCTVTYLLNVHINTWLGKKQQFQLPRPRERLNE